MTNIKRIAKISLTILLFVLMNGQVEASELNFSVTPILPDNQVDSEKTYFDIKLAPKAQQTLEVTLQNNTAKAVTIETLFNRATTNINGIVEYGMSKNKKDSSLTYNIEELVTIEQPEITLQPQTKETLKINVQAPSEDFAGILASGLTFKEKSVVAKNEKKAEGMAIKNEYAYVVALIMHGNVAQDTIESQLLLNQVKANQVNRRNVISANLQNPQAKFLNKLNITAKITKKGQSDVLYEAKSKQLQMAPNSNFDYPVRLDGQKLQAGVYTLKLHGTAPTGEWSLAKDFTISKEEAKKYNAKDVLIKKDYTWWYLAAGILGLLLIQLLIYLVVRRKKQKNKKSKKRVRKSQT